MASLKWIYLSRQFNRIGYSILDYLINEGIHKPCAILLPKGLHENPLNDISLRDEEINRYIKETEYYRCMPYRFMKSISQYASENNIPILELSTIKGQEAIEVLKKYEIELIVLGGGWPELLPDEVFQFPKLGTINTHPSLLPEFRGTDIHRWQILHGVQKSGVTIHRVDQNFDTGPILGKIEIEIFPDDSPQDLANKAAHVAGPLMGDILTNIQDAMPEYLSGIEQLNQNDVCKYFHKWDWCNQERFEIDWNCSALAITRFVLACTQESYRYNGPFFYFQDKAFILREVDIVELSTVGLPGQVIRRDDDVFVYCGSELDALRIKKIQPINLDDWSLIHPMAAMSGCEWFIKFNIKNGDYLLKKSITG